MIPIQNAAPLLIKREADTPTRTYRLDAENQRVSGLCEGIPAMQQAAFKILQTERFVNLIYSSNYGTELAGLFGQPVSFVYPELERRITEALMQDKRIQTVDGFSFEKKKGAVSCSFSVHTTEGGFNISQEVRI